MFYLIHLISRFRLTGLVAASVYAMLSVIYVPAQAQVAVGVNEALAAPIAPLGAITVPDVNVLGILDRSGPNAKAWPQITNSGNQTRLQQFGKAAFWDMQVGGDGIQACASCHYHAGADNRKTNQMSPGLKRVLGGVDPVTDANRAPDHDHELAQAGPATGPNQALTDTDSYSGTDGNTGDLSGFPVSEPALIAEGATSDLVDGTPGLSTGNVSIDKPDPAVDVNDVTSSQGVRQHQHVGISCYDNDTSTVVTCDDPTADTTYRVDTATLQANDDGFNTVGFSDFPTSRRVEPRNSPTALNAVYHLRNFWDGRADAFFNGVNPLGFRDPGARVLTYDGSLDAEKLRIPFSSLASQAVGPIESDFEMVFAGRLHRELGRKLLAAGVEPLAGQLIDQNDSLLGALRDSSDKRGLAIPANSYEMMIRQIFDQRFWGDGTEKHVCLNYDGTDYINTANNGNPIAPTPTVTVEGTADTAELCRSTYPDTDFTLMEWNFSLFFGLGVQAYEALLTTEQTPVDLLVGGVAKGQVINTVTRRGRIVQQNVVDVGLQPGSNIGLPLEGCIQLAGQGLNRAARAVAADLCMQHYAQFMHPKATSGSQSNNTDTPIPAGTAIGGCTNNPAEPVTEAENGVVTTIFCNGDPQFASEVERAARLAAVTASLTAIDRGMGRFFAGATGCGICHFNPEFTGATVSALTGFGAAPVEVLPPGQVNRIPPELPMERMIAFNGAQAVYDSGFYNLGVRPTPEDLSIGDLIGGVPLAFTKLTELINVRATNGPVDPPYNEDAIDLIATELAVNPGTGLNQLLIPTAPDNLAPRPFLLEVACGPGLVGNAGGNGNGNGAGGPNAGDGGEPANNPIPQCNPTIEVGERLLRNGAFKAQDIRMSRLTGPFMHNGSKMSIEQVINFYETEGHFPTLNFNNLDAGLRIFDLGAQDTAALNEFIDTGLTDFRVVHEEGDFDHPELCVPNGHDPDTGKTILAGIPAVGSGGAEEPLATFMDILNGTAGHEHTLQDDCTIPGIHTNGLSDIDDDPEQLLPPV